MVGRLIRADHDKYWGIIDAISTLLWPDSIPDNRWNIPRSAWWIYWVKGEAVGICGIRPMQEYPKLEPRWKETAMLCRCGLLPSARGRNIQRRMIRKRVQWAREQGYKRVATYTSVDNIASLRSLIREGFLPYRGNKDWVWLEKEL